MVSECIIAGRRRDVLVDCYFLGYWTIRDTDIDSPGLEVVDGYGCITLIPGDLEGR